MKEHYFSGRLCLLALSLLLLSGSCKKTSSSGAFTIGFWSVDLNTSNFIPGDPSRKDHAYALLNLMSDSTLHYDIYFNALTSGDVPGGVQIFQGTPAENGNQFLSLSGVQFNGQNSASGSVLVNTTQIDSLLSPTAPHYLVVSSKMAPSGLVRGQIGAKIIYALDVNMSGAGVNPPVNSTATGSCVLRLLSDNVTLYYNVQVSGVAPGDVLTSAAVRRTADNSVVLQLAASAADFSRPINKALASATVSSLENDHLYIDVRSVNYPGGLISGVIR